jgi:spermidine synthase
VRTALVLSGVAGWLALSYEILWYRMVSFTSRGMASGFSLLLGAYLLGLAAGAGACRVGRSRDGGPFRALAKFVLLANGASFAVVPVVSWLVTFEAIQWPSTLPLVAVAAAGMGAVFPLLAEAAVAADERAGLGVSRLYVATILGSVAGTLLTGFVLMQAASQRTTSLLLGLAGAAMAGAIAWLDGRRPRVLVPAAASALAVALLTPVLFDGVYERLQRKSAYRAGYRYAHVVETRSGVVTVEEDGTVNGGGIYDGVYNVDPSRPANDIVRAHAVAALHPAPRDVLQIGLASGSWASVLSSLPQVERLTVVEINPGYLQLIPKYPEVEGILRDPKVKIEIDDGRRWLVRNADRKFDVIIGNIWHWRAGATNLLSKEFLALVRSRLKPGGIFYYNTTGSGRVVKTGLETFPYALKVRSYLTVSDAPIEFRVDALRAGVSAAVSAGRPIFDLRKPEDRERVERTVASVASGLLDRARLLESTSGEAVITDDNMGSEWSAEWLQ